jgi:hypothetical protein
MRRGMLDLVLQAKELNAAVDVNHQLSEEISRLRERIGRLLAYENRLATLIRAAGVIDAEIALARSILHDGDLCPEPVTSR